jgi:hypothetical protein
MDLEAPGSALGAMAAARNQQEREALRAVLVGLEVWTHPMVHRTGTPPATHSSAS